MIASVASSDAAGLGVGGLIGALGVTVAIAVEHPRLLSPWWLTGAAALGFVAGLPFEPWLAHVDYRLNGSPIPDPVQPLRLACAFAIWQAAIGTYL